MSNNYEILKWDTDFFGYPVARIHGNDLAQNELDRILTEMKGKAKLVYYASAFPLAGADDLLSEFNGLLVDQKVTFYKVITTAAEESNPNIVEYQNGMNKEELVDLSIASGIYSRYKMDPNIGVLKYQALYREWMLNSINHVLAKKVLVYVVDNEELGAATLAIKDNVAEIGVIAVKETKRGLGIGKSLMGAADSFAIANELPGIRVITQGANKPACALYTGKGYEIKKVEYFYHFWL